MTGAAAYAGLFASAFLAATILPAQSEALLTGMILSEAYSLPLLLMVASIGNTLGSTVNYALGRGIGRLEGSRFQPASAASLDRARRWYRRYGRWSLLASWLPIVGDPLTVVAGVLREPFWSFLLLVAIAKSGRYLVLAAAIRAW